MSWEEEKGNEGGEGEGDRCWVTQGAVVLLESAFWKRVGEI